MRVHSGNLIGWHAFFFCEYIAHEHKHTLNYSWTRKWKALWGKPSNFKLGGQLSAFFLRGCLRDRLNSRTRDLMKKDRENQRWSASNVVVRFFFFAWTHQPIHEFDCCTRSGCRCLWGTHVGGHARTRYRVGRHGLRLPMRKKMNVEEKAKLERLKQLFRRSQLAPS